MANNEANPQENVPLDDISSFIVIDTMIVVQTLKKNSKTKTLMLLHCNLWKIITRIIKGYKVANIILIDVWNSLWKTRLELKGLQLFTPLWISIMFIMKWSWLTYIKDMLSRSKTKAQLALWFGLILGNNTGSRSY